MKKLLTALVFSVAMVLVGCEDPGQEVFEDFERITGNPGKEIDDWIDKSADLDDEIQKSADLDDEIQ